ncbi:MAG: hypothetical protein V3V17_06640 [Alphaproteobacteria bacterium]
MAKNAKKRFSRPERTQGSDRCRPPGLLHPRAFPRREEAANDDISTAPSFWRRLVPLSLAAGGIAALLLLSQT